MREIKRGDMYCADLRPVIGSEQGGVRPVIILQNDVGNKYSPTTIVAAITGRKNKAQIPTHIPIQSNALKRDSVILLEQIRTIDKSRLGEFIGQVDEDTMQCVDRAIAVSFGMNGFGTFTEHSEKPKVAMYMRVATEEQLSELHDEVMQSDMEEENSFVMSM